MKRRSKNPWRRRSIGSSKTASPPMKCGKRSRIPSANMRSDYKRAPLQFSNMQDRFTVAKAYRVSQITPGSFAGLRRSKSRTQQRLTSNLNCCVWRLYGERRSRFWEFAQRIGKTTKSTKWNRKSTKRKVFPHFLVPFCDPHCPFLCFVPLSLVKADFESFSCRSKNTRHKEALARFQREDRAVAALSHPNIVRFSMW